MWPSLRIQIKDSEEGINHQDPCKDLGLHQGTPVRIAHLTADFKSPGSTQMLFAKGVEALDIYKNFVAFHCHQLAFSRR